MWLLFLVSVAWGFSFGLIKGNLTGVDSIFVAFARMILSLLVFLPFIKFKKIGKALFWKLFLTGVLQFGVMYIAYIAAFRYLKAYEVALFTIFTPIYVTLINDALNKKINALYLLTALLAVAGTWIIEQSQILSAGVLTGFVLVQLSNLAFAFGQIYYRKLLAASQDLKDHEVFGVLYLGAAAVTLLATVIFTPLNVLLTCSLSIKFPNFEIKIVGLGILRAVPSALELRYGIYPESKNLQWSNCGSNCLQGWGTCCKDYPHWQCSQ